MQKINYFPNRDTHKTQLKHLPKIDERFLMLDFDDTIFSRSEQLRGDDEISNLLIKNRGAAGNRVILDEIGIDTLIKKYYENKNFPQGLVEAVRKNSGMILTAGEDQIQKAKLEATNLLDIDAVIVEKGYSKPEALLRHFAETYNKIPSCVEIYEDRPEHFLATKKDMEILLGTKIKIFYVLMRNNSEEPEILEVENLEDLASVKK